MPDLYPRLFRYRTGTSECSFPREWRLKNIDTPFVVYILQKEAVAELRGMSVLICAAGDIHGALERLYDDVLAFEAALSARFDWRKLHWVEQSRVSEESHGERRYLLRVFASNPPAVHIERHLRAVT